MNLKPNTLRCINVCRNRRVYNNEMALKGEVIKIHFQRLYVPGVLCFCIIMFEEGEPGFYS